MTTDELGTLSSVAIAVVKIVEAYVSEVYETGSRFPLRVTAMFDITFPDTVTDVIDTDTLETDEIADEM